MVAAGDCSDDHFWQREVDTALHTTCHTRTQDFRRGVHSTADGLKWWIGGAQTLADSFSGGASAVKEPGHFEVRKFSSQVILFSRKVEDLFQLSPSKHRPPTPFRRQNKTVRYGNIFNICLHYYRSKAIRKARQGGARAELGRWIFRPRHLTWRALV